MGRWRERTFPVQVRIYPEPFDRGHWQLWSRHRRRGEASRRAYAEACREYPNATVMIVDADEP